MNPYPLVRSTNPCKGTPDLSGRTIARATSCRLKPAFPSRIRSRLQSLTAGCWIAVLLSGFAILLSGCQAVKECSLTYRVWGDGNGFQKFSEPAEHPNLALFDAKNRADVLVVYDAFSEKQSAPVRCAYFLESNRDVVAAGKQPQFVEPGVSSQMPLIPVMTAQAILSSDPAQWTSYAVMAREGRGFTLHRPTKPTETFDLPVYRESSGTTKQVLLTPVAVVGDTVMVCAVAAIIGFLMWVQSGAPT